MRLLLVHESPLEKIGDRYYAVDPWIRFPMQLARHCDGMTLLVPVVVRGPEESPLPESWRLEDSLQIVHHDFYQTFVQYYSLWLRKAWAWRRRVDDLVREHDLVVLRHPSPMIGLIGRSAARCSKPFVILLVGDIAAQSDRILGSAGLKRVLYRMALRWWVYLEKRWCRRASLIYVYSSELATRHLDSQSKVKRMRTPHLSAEDFVYRQETCQDEEIRLLRVCWMVPSKGLECLLRTVALLVGRGLPIRLDLVGKERVPGYQASLERLARSLGIGNCVEFCGWIPFDRLQEKYSQSDIQVISSLAEGTPRVILEGAARGLPLVSTNVGGIPDAVRDGYDGVLVPPGEPVSLADGIENVIKDSLMCRQLIEGGYRSAREASFDRVGMKFLADLQSLVSEGA